MLNEGASAGRNLPEESCFCRLLDWFMSAVALVAFLAMGKKR